VIRGILLCGGMSSRFGSDKLLARHSGERGHPIGAQSARHLIAGAGNALAIIPAGAGELRDSLAQAGCEILESPATAGGLGASLAAAVAASADADGWIVALGDMPFIRIATIAAVRSSLEEGALIAAPVLRATGQRGHPVGFSRALREDLSRVGGDEGARAVVALHRSGIVLIEVDDPGIVKDIDTPADLQRDR